jgi:hypothetical protein
VGEFFPLNSCHTFLAYFSGEDRQLGAWGKVTAMGFLIYSNYAGWKYIAVLCVFT